MRHTMKIAVCIKHVLARDSQPRLDDDKTWIRESDAAYEMNEPDAYALEEALRLNEKRGGEVVVCSAGPARVAQVHSRSARSRRRPGDPRRRRRPRPCGRRGGGRRAGRRDGGRAVRSDPHRVAVRRSGVRADGRHPRGAPRALARDDHHGGRPGTRRRRRARSGQGCASSASSKAGGSSGSRCRCRRS